MMGKRILFIAPASFPANSAEAIVNLKQLKLLCDNGYKIDVISKKMKWAQYPEEQYEQTLINLSSLHILEIDNKVSIQTVWTHLLTYLSFGIVYKGAHWAYLGLTVCKQLIAKKKYDYVITKNYPSELLGYYLKKKYNIKWVATWNDPFPHEKYPHPYGNGPMAKLSYSKRRLLKVMAKYADIHMFPSERLRDYMLQYLAVDMKKTRIAPHIVLDETHTPNISSKNILRIVHTGNLHSPRDPNLFLEGLMLFLEKVPEARIEFTFIGVMDDGFEENVKNKYLTKYVVILDPVSYDESLEIIKNYDIAMIIEAPCYEGIFLPTKVSDYMQCHKHIFSISPKDGVLHDLYSEDIVKYYADCTNVTSILNAIEQMYFDFINGDIEINMAVKSEYRGCSILKTFNDLF